MLGEKGVLILLKKSNGGLNLWWIVNMLICINFLFFVWCYWCYIICVYDDSVIVIVLYYLFYVYVIFYLIGFCLDMSYVEV